MTPKCCYMRIEAWQPGDMFVAGISLMRHGAGKPVNTLFVAKKMALTREMYFAILLDRASAQVVMIGCGEGGSLAPHKPCLHRLKLACALDTASI